MLQKFRNCQKFPIFCNKVNFVNRGYLKQRVNRNRHLIKNRNRKSDEIYLRNNENLMH